MSNFPESPIDGALAEVANADGSAVQYRYDKAEAAWKIVGKTGEGLSQYVTTSDVVTTSEAPVYPTGFNGLKSLGDIQYLTNQKLVNWTLAESVIDLQDEFETDQQRQDDAIDELRQEITDGDFTPGLQKVLDEGNIANKNLFLTNGEDDLIDLSITERRIVMGARGEESVPKFELRHYNGIDQSNASFEIDEGGTRLDFEAEGKIDNMHFRFGNQDKLILNKSGDAVFEGKVQGVPGTQNNEFVTYGQLLTVEEELEQLAPSLDRGTWNYTSNYPPASGEYTLIKEILTAEAQETLCQLEYTTCLLEADGDAADSTACNRTLAECQAAVDGDGLVVTTNKFEEATSIKFNEIDSNNVSHDFKGIDPDHLLDLFNESDDSFGIFDINSHDGGLFSVEVMSSRGTAVGLSTRKIFKHEGSVDFDQYVRKQGDTMSGSLTIDSGKELALYIKGNADSNATLFYARGLADTTLFRINCNGQVQAGTDAANAFMATADNDVTTKKWVESNTVKAISPGIEIGKDSNTGVYYITGG